MKTAALSHVSHPSLSLRQRSRKIQLLPAALGFVGALALNLGIAQAHIELTDPPMRGGDQKTGPCEGEARGTPIEYEGGSTITVEWTETIDHGGSFVISLDLDGDDFDGDGDGEFDFPAAEGFEDSGSGNGDLVLLEVEDTGGSDFTAEVTLPDVACDNCTLQLLQNMAGNMPTDNDPTAHIYFRCADIVITSENGGGGAGSGGAGPGGGGNQGLPGGFGGEIFGGAGGIPTIGGGGSMPFPTEGGAGGVDRPAPVPDPVVPPAGTTPPAVTTPVAPLPSTPAPTVTTNPGLIAPPPASSPPAVAPNPSPVPAGDTATGSPSAAPSGSSSAAASDDSGDDSSCSLSVAPRSAAWSLLLALGATLALSRRRRLR